MFRDLSVRILNMPRPIKRVILIIFDVIALSFVLWVSFSLRYDRWTAPENIDSWLVILFAPLVAVPIFWQMGLYRPVMRYLPERALWTMFRAVGFAAMAWVIVAFLTALLFRAPIPRAVPVIYWALACIVVLGSRFVAKGLIWTMGRDLLIQRPAVLVYGAGAAGTQLVTSLHATHHVVGFIDDDPTLQKRDVAGVRVHPPSAVPRLSAEYSVKHIILSMPSISPQRRKQIFESVSTQGVKVQFLPDIIDLISGRYLVSQVREIDVDDLLGRSSVPPDVDLIRQMVVGRTIMVTGAGGSIGSELCRKIAQWSPQRLILFESNEFALYQIDRELAGTNDASAVPVLGSVVDAQLIERTIKQFGVDVVFHAAAHKHVPLVEANALEGIRNNVFGTKTVVDVAFETGVKNFVLISTDKAVRPTNVMGATKRWAELIVREKATAAIERNTGQHFCAVRFGNVLGSNGSVVPLFREQISHGGPITLTDPAMTRYFMSIKEAAELIVQAGALSEGGDVFLLDMGEPMLISELAENMVRLAGLMVKSDANPQGDIEIVTTGKRPGEKLYEELFYDDSTARRTRHPKILRAITSLGDVKLQSYLDILQDALRTADERRARQILFELIALTDSEALPGDPH